jgi:hypothetical protein
MPPVILAVTAIGSAVIGAVGGAAFLAGLSLSAFVGVTLVAGTAIIAGGAMLATKLMSIDMPGVPDNDKSRQVTTKSTVEPMKIIYGQALVSGPLAYIGVAGNKNEDLHHVIALAGHEVEAITDVWLDDEVIINPTGQVTTGTFGPVDVIGVNTTICTIFKYLGTADQLADPVLKGRFPDYGDNNRGRGIAYIHTIFKLNAESEEVWEKYAPNNIRALVKGRKIYDPRLDVAAGNLAGANPTNPSYIAYSDNPALCVADYLTNTEFGMGVATTKVDWVKVIVAADACDVSVLVPGGTEKRFTANGVLFGTDPHMTSINKLLSSMNGSLIYSGGEYAISAGVYQEPTHFLTEDDLAGSVTVKTSVERADRFNTVKAIIIDPAQNNKSVEVPRVQLTAALNRDNGETFEREIKLPFTNTSFMAQRIANKLIQMSDQQKLLTFPANLSAMAISVGDRVEVTIGELGFATKVFRCMGWSFTESGISLTLAEDDPGSYEDPAALDYSTVSAAGIISNGFPGVPDPQGLTATAGVKSIDLNWRNPGNTSKFSNIVIYASQTNQWSVAVEIGRGLITAFKHDASTAADPIAAGDQRWYWVRALGTGSSASVFSDRSPDNDNSNVTAIALTNAADSVEWIDVANFNNLRPDDNATVGATAGTNLTDSIGTVLNDDDVLNSVVFEDITEVQLAGTGDILQLVGGARVDLQQLGDVAAYAFNNGQYLLGITNDLDASFGNLQQTVVDISAGTTDVFVSDEPPVAGVGGVPDPIDIYSRWYDSNDNNKPYYWNGVSWIDLSDPRIASNQSEIAAVSANLDGTITTVGGHTTQIATTASALSILDATVVLIDEDLVALTGSYDAFVLAYEQSDPNAQITANAEAIDTLELQIEVIDGLIAVSATDITELNVEMKFYTKLDAVDGETLQLVNGEEIDLQGTSAVGGATGTAVAILDTRIVETERGISVTSQDIVSLTSALNDTNLNLAGEANAISNLTTIVEIQGDTITANSSDITTLNADLTSEAGVRATAVSELNVRVTSAEGTITSNSSNITSLESNLATTNSNVSGNATALTVLGTRVTSAEGTITSISSDITSLQASLSTTDGNVIGNATAITSIDTRVTSAEGTITSQATSISNLTTTVGTNTASITTQSNSIDGIEANYGVKVDINGRITGFGLNSTAATATPTSQFYVIADNFAVVNPASTADTPLIPFSVNVDPVTLVSTIGMTANVTINGDLVTSGSISADYISIDGVTLDTDGSGNLIINSEGVGTAQLAGSAVTIDKIADSIQSSDYVTGVSGWKITKAGASEFSNVVVRGSVDAGSINIDGVTLDTDPISGNLIVRTGGVNTPQLAPNAATYLVNSTISTTRNYSPDGTYVAHTLTFTGTGAAAEIYGDASFAVSLNNSFTTMSLEFNGSFVDTYSIYSGHSVMTAGVTTLVGTNTIRLIFLVGPAISGGGEYINVYRTYLRAIEAKR